jgi:hypothetical protein
MILEEMINCFLFCDCPEQEFLLIWVDCLFVLAMPLNSCGDMREVGWLAG